MSKKAWIIIIAVIAILFGYLIYSGKHNNQNQNNNSAATTANPAVIKSDDYVTGSKDRKYVVIEYVDLACPACKEFYPTMKSTIQKYGDQVTFVERYFPLTSIHPNAMVSARAAQAAGNQGKFFEMEDLLFTNQDSWFSMPSNEAQKTFAAYAQRLGLNMDQYNKDVASDATLTRINEDRDLAVKLNLTGTPSFFVNGQTLKLNQQTDLENKIKDVIKNNQTDSANYKK